VCCKAGVYFLLIKISCPYQQDFITLENKIIAFEVTALQQNKGNSNVKLFIIIIMKAPD
jgi:hypothetical protein